MTVESRIVKTPYSGNDARTTWPIIFPVSTADGSDIEVWLTPPETSVIRKPFQLTSNFSVDMDNLNVVYPTPESELPPLPTGWGLLLLRNVPLTQGVHWEDRGPFSSRTLEGVLDRVVMGMQQLDEKVQRAPKYAVDQTPEDEDTDSFISAVTELKGQAENAADEATTQANTALQAAGVATAEAGAATTQAQAAAASAQAAAAVVAEKAALEADGTYEQIIARAAGAGGKHFSAWATDKDLLLYYTGNAGKGDRGFIITGSAAVMSTENIG